jgi:hypothetical protein
MPQATLDPDTVVTRAPDVVGVHVGSALVLHDPRRDSYARLNQSGEALWEHLSRPRRLAELATALTERYRLPPADALEDARRMVLGLVARGMVAVDDR